MSVLIETGENEISACLSGEIDHHSATEIREKIDLAVEGSKPGVLTLDFKDVTFMDSSGIGLVMGRYKLMQMLGGRVKVVNTSRHIRKVMRLAGLDRLAAIE